VVTRLRCRRFTHVSDGPAPYFTFARRHDDRRPEFALLLARVKAAASDAIVAYGAPSPTIMPSGAITGRLRARDAGVIPPALAACKAELIRTACSTPAC
jgi:hypothetical protein